jgi:capsid protein
MTLSEVQRSFGFVPSDLLDELAEDLKGARERGLVLAVDMSKDPQHLFAVQNGAAEPTADGEGQGGDTVQGGNPS